MSQLHHEFSKFVLTYVALETQDFGNADTRWSIRDLGPDSFVWREEESLDGGKTWRLTAEHHMKRRAQLRAASATIFSLFGI